MWEKKRTIMHIDVNSAFLSWTVADMIRRGEPTNALFVPSVIGGSEENRHGIVLAKSIPAKQYGIKTGESLYSARKKCKNLLVLSPHYDIYQKYSNQFYNILCDYSPLVERFSIDECFLDYTAMEKHFGEAVDCANRIKKRIESELGFTVNIGISSNKLLAKMASDFEKPNKVHTLFPDEVKEKMWPLPVGDLFMVGRKTLPLLKQKGIFTIGDLANYDPKLLTYHFKSYGKQMWLRANGIDESRVQNEAPPAKGIGNSATSSKDMATREEALMLLLSLCESVSNRLRKSNFKTSCICVSIRTKDFSNFSHSKSISIATNSTNTIYSISTQLFDEMWRGNIPLRHIGVQTSKLIVDESQQISIWDLPEENNIKLDMAIDSLRLKYGKTSIMRGCFTNTGLNPICGSTGMFPCSSNL